jgi:hypothetical protein
MGYEIKTNMMGEICSTYREKEKCVQGCGREN